MSIKELFLLLLGSIVSSNFALVHFFGSESILSFKKEGIEKNIKTSLSLAVVLVISSLIIYPVEKLLLGGGESGLRVLVYVVVILLVEAVVFLLTKEKGSGILPLVVSSSTLGPVLFFQSAGYTFLETLFSSLGCALGYLLLTLAISSVKEKINDKYVPSQFRGYPILFIALSIIALTVYCF